MVEHPFLFVTKLLVYVPNIFAKCFLCYMLMLHDFSLCNKIFSGCYIYVFEQRR